jgi:ComF family protein
MTSLERFALRPLRQVAMFALDAVLPPRCLACGETVAQQGQVCGPCWIGIDFIAGAVCHHCGLPFEVPMEPGAVCAACAAEPPPWARARSVMRYGETSRRLILRFKHGDKLESVPSFGQWLARAGSELLGDAELIAPVPLHRWRLFRRRYNQSAMLALALGRSARVPVITDLLARIRATPSQGGLGAKERAENVRGAFAIREKHRNLIAGRRVLLVDDVLTTGATVGACAKVLTRAGASSVDVLTLARVVRPVH